MINNNNKLLKIYQQYKDTYHLLLDAAEKYVYKYIKKMYEKYQVVIVIGDLVKYDPKQLYQLRLMDMVDNKFIQTNIIGEEKNIRKYIENECKKDSSGSLRQKDIDDLLLQAMPLDNDVKAIAQQYSEFIENYKETPEKKYITKDGRDISWRTKEYDMDGYETGEWEWKDDDWEDDEFDDDQE